ncbi:MAG: ketopantoate reductase family protein [Desulfurivibrionaceae bacterium]|jgi:2-dehydropantoate 2-reductase|nr:2-dehydropantoate 2-reductase [Pseudomonadota bacterium]MCG2824005.1 2-dehydropantoate 2-reductase [Desulfobulbaceae bacterium]MDP2003402.1 2-dehydropantoate 2-reductase [Desulfurivibrionaceae bacterium]MBU4229805.1 2-dehydropantoate 2-reductase [Pseudomonadota bacterium]MBU4408465.1 2-dehydropantoate 2-reductase [Pseudomonadota bacterium]
MRDIPSHRVAIVGPGALGCLLAASLGRIGVEIRVLDHDSQRAGLLQHSGLTLEHGGRFEHFSIQATADPLRIGPVDLVLLCVKSPALLRSLPAILPLLTQNTLLLAWQNGIGHLPVLQEAELPCPVALAVTSLGAHLVGPGRVRFGGKGATSFGFLREAPEEAKPALQETAGLFRRAGLEVRVEEDIQAQVWNKLLVNVGINALTVIHDCENGALLGNSGALQLMGAAVREAAEVALAKGIAIAPDPVARTIAVCRATAANISSMLQDVRHTRQTEIGAINGAVLEEAMRLGIPAPVNAELFAAVRGMEQSYLPG